MGRQVRAPGEIVRDFILANLERHPNDIVTRTAERFGCSRQAVHKHLGRLLEQGAIVQSGPRQKPDYKLGELERESWEFPISRSLAESDVWEKAVRPRLDQLPKNVLSIWEYAFTEIVNNAIDHSDGKSLAILLTKTAIATTIDVTDDGIGIFKKIQQELDLVDQRLALFELSKGKLTTDPRNHTGQGIFFSSRMMDEFNIFSGELSFFHEKNDRYDVLLERERPKRGTTVTMTLNNHTSRSTKKVFDEFSSQDGDYRFNKTIVPMTLAKYGTSELVSRSQAKRLLSRFDQFEIVLIDFKGVETIGQAFADEIFRVFERAHPEIKLHPVNMTVQVKDMVSRAQSQPAV